MAFTAWYVSLSTASLRQERGVPPISLTRTRQTTGQTIWYGRHIRRTLITAAFMERFLREGVILRLAYLRRM
ncbi:hypothetical protein BM547_30885 [Pseudomonas aeruginosa]|nr:hypothetical protein BM547_30885 [Pseudomonas aeruginosa]